MLAAISKIGGHAEITRICVLILACTINDATTSGTQHRKAWMTDRGTLNCLSLCVVESSGIDAEKVSRAQSKKTTFAVSPTKAETLAQ